MKALERISLFILLGATMFAVIAWPIALGLTLNQAWKNIIDSSFVISAFCTLVAAFAGAFGAQYIAERNKNREFLLREIRNTNAAIVIAFGICNHLLNLKSQHVRLLKKNYDRDRAEVIEKLECNAPQTLRFVAELQIIQPPSPPTDILNNHVFEKLSAEGRILSLAPMIHQALNSLSDSIEKRNNLVKNYQASSLSQSELATLYFGLPYGEGHVDAAYPSTLEAIVNQLDDCIHFTKIMCWELHDYGQYIRKRFGNNAPFISRPDFTKAEKSGLMPDPAVYVGWEKAFEKKYPKSSGLV